MAERRLQGLERVLGVNALFSTAYGNVGSSIYYALGLVASYALGLTPVVFIITGFFFFCTAATYAEATAMYPEAGGSSSLRPPRVQRVLVVLRRLGADAQLHDHGRDLGVLRAALHRRRCSGTRCATRPGDIIGGIVVVAVLGAINIVGVKESDRRQRAAGGRRLRHAAAAGARRRRSSCSRPQTLVNNVHLGVAPTWKDFLLAIPIGMLAYTGIETISNMAEEAKDEATTIPAAIKRVRDRRVRDLLHAARRRAVRAAGRAASPTARTRRCSA